MTRSARFSIHEGATLERIYWATPGMYHLGEPFGTRADAIAAGIVFVSNIQDPTEYTREEVYVDERWVFRLDGGTTDLVIHREVIPTLAEAREALRNALRWEEEE